MKKEALKASMFSIFGNIFLALIKATAGIIGNSYALIADAIESSGDIISSIFVLLGLKFSSKPADANHPYGHGKIEALSTMFISFFLFISALVIAFQSIENIKTPHEVPESWTLLILAGIIGWKEISFRYVMKQSKKTKNSSLEADAWHHRSDSLTSFAAFIGIFIAIIFGEKFAVADDYAALVASGLIFFNSYRILRPALGEILDENIYEEVIVRIRTLAKDIPEVCYTEKCYVRKNGTNYNVDLHISVDGELTVRKGHEIAHKLQDYLKNNIIELHKIIIHVEPDKK